MSIIGILTFGLGIGPLGDYLAGPLFAQDGILVADLDLGQVIQGKSDFDVAGHYARPDVFRLVVNEQPAPPVQTVWEEEDAGMVAKRLDQDNS